MNVSLIYDIKLTATQVRFGRYAVFRKACFTGHHYTGNSIAAVEKTFFFKNMEKKKTYQVYRIILRPVRPLNNGFSDGNA